MSMTDQGQQQPAGFVSGLIDLVTNLKGVVRNLAQINTTLGNTFPRITGTFTLANATTTVVTQAAIKANSIVAFTPTNGTAALTQRTGGLFHSANAAGASFSISTQSGTAAGSETFEYVVINPS